MAEQKKLGKNDVKAVVILQIQAGRATPAPPLGPTLGQNGVNIAKFCEEFNAQTRDKGADVLPVQLTVFGDNSYKMKIKEPTVVSMLKKAAGIEKGSAHPKKDKVGKVKKAQLRQIAERKLPDLNTKDVDAATKIVAGSANSLGLEIVD